MQHLVGCGAVPVKEAREDAQEEADEESEDSASDCDIGGVKDHMRALLGHGPGAGAKAPANAKAQPKPIPKKTTPSNGPPAPAQDKKLGKERAGHRQSFAAQRGLTENFSATGGSASSAPMVLDGRGHRLQQSRP